MRRIRKNRTRVDALRSEARPKKRGRIGRYVYLGFLAALALWIFDIFVGDLFYLRGRGMLTREVSVISLGYRGTVRSLPVEEGQRVTRDELLMRVHSTRMSKDIASLSADLAKVEGDLSKLKTRRENLKSLLPAARERMNELQTFRDNMRELGKAGLTTSLLNANVLTDSFRALRDFKELQTEARTLEQEITNTQDTAGRIRDALTQLREIYNGGRVVSPTSGLLGTLEVKPGSSVEPGDRVAEIFHGPRYVLAYVPTGTIYDVDIGDRVALRYGFRLMQGEVTRLLPLARRLPKEFQRAFESANRDQLVRIRVGEAAKAPPLFTKMRVTWSASPRVVALQGIGWLDSRVRGAVRWVFGGRDPSRPETEDDA